MTGIRTDANSIIATGHMMRCITIARQIVNRGESVTFFIADDESRRLLEKNLGDSGSINVVVLDTAWDDMESELPVLIEQLQLRNVDTLLVDSYKVTYDYFKAVSRVCRTVYIDDVHEGIYPVDMLINYSGYYDRFDYISDYKDMHGHADEPTKLLLGLKYAPLREQFGVSAGDRDNNGQVFKVLLAAGGGDIHNMLPSVLKAAVENGLLDNGTEIHVVVGDYAGSAEETLGFASLYEGIIVHRSVSDMASLMGSCDLAVVAAGTMLTECAAVKLPAVFYQVADNQRYGTEYWSASDRMIYAGDVTKDKDGVIADILKYVRALEDDRDRLNKISDRIGKITDGRGAERIAEEICDLR